MLIAQKRRILVLEGDIHLCNGIQDILELEGYLIAATMDISAALNVLDSFFPELVIMDFNAASHSALKVLIEHCQYLYPAIYLCASYKKERILREFPFIQSSELLTKPFDAEDLLAATSYIFDWQDRLSTW